MTGEEALAGVIDALKIAKDRDAHRCDPAEPCLFCVFEQELNKRREYLQLCDRLEGQDD